MPTAQLSKQAEVVRTDLARLEADVRTLLTSVGGAIGGSISGRVNESLNAVASHLDPLLALLGSTAATSKRGPGRPKLADGESPKKRGRRRGGRGRKVNLTAEAIQDALKESGGNKTAAAKALGVSQPTFYKYLGALTSNGSGAAPATAKASASKKSRPKAS